MVGTVDQFDEGVVSLHLGEPDAHRAGMITIVEDRVYLVEANPNRREVSPGNRAQELIAAVAHDGLVAAQLRPYGAHDIAQPRVSRGVAGSVVGLLEPVDVDVRHDEALAGSPCAVDLVLQGNLPRAAPVRTREMVDVGTVELGAGVAAIPGRVFAVPRRVLPVACGPRPVGLGLLSIERRPAAIGRSEYAIGSGPRPHIRRLDDRHGVLRAARSLGVLTVFGCPVAGTGGAIPCLRSDLAIRRRIVADGGDDIGGRAYVIGSATRLIGFTGRLLTGMLRRVGH